MLTFAASVPSSGTDYNVVWIILGAVGIIEGVKSGLTWLGHRAVRNKNLDDLIATRAQIAEVDKKISVNGKNTDNVGDVAKRTEEITERIESKLDNHIASANRQSGENAANFREVWRRLGIIEGK